MNFGADQIRINLEQVKGKIARAAERSSRNVDEIKLVVVTKAQPVEKVRAVIEAGAVLLGENYPEETVVKIEALKDYSNIKWHMIGHLQSRKIPLVINGFDFIHSIDGLSLAEKLSLKMQETGKKKSVLIEINVSGEDSKNGFAGWQESDWPLLMNTIATINGLPGINLRGLMTMPPYFTDVEKSRPYFVKLRKLRDYIQERLSFVKLDELSMGTSADFQVAIEEGATYIRVGQAIMGERKYH